MICPRCKNNVLDGSTYCVKCGFNFSTNNNGTENSFNNNQGNPQVSNQMMNNNMPNNANFNNGLNSNVTYGNNNSNNPNAFKVKKSNNVVSIIVIIVIVGVLGFLGYKFFMNKDENTNNNGSNGNSGNINGNANNDISKYETVGHSFLIPDVTSTYALFNYKGEKLTNFVYYTPSHKGFRDGSILVRNLDFEDFLMDESGKELTVPGEYESIKEDYVMYDATFTKDNQKKNNTTGYYLSSKGEKIYNKNDYKILQTKSSSFPYALIQNIKTKEVNYVNEDGTKVFSVDYNDSANFDTYVISYDEKYISIFYNNYNYIVDIENDKLLGSFASNIQYCAATYSEKDNLLITSKCNDSDSGSFFKVIKNNKIIDSSEIENRCNKKNDSMYKRGKTLFYKYDRLFCRIDLFDEYYMFDSNLKYLGDTKEYGIILDFNNYFKDGKIYKNNKEVKSLSCVNALDASIIDTDGYYRLTNSNKNGCSGDGLISLYDSDGNKIGNESYYKLGLFDDNGLAIAADSNRKYFLINKKGQRVSESFDSITSSKGACYVSETNNKFGLLSINGKTVESTKYDSVRCEGTHAELLNKNSSGKIKIIAMLDLKNNKKVTVGENETLSNAYDDYYYIYNESKYEYYVYYNNEKIYTASYSR